MNNKPIKLYDYPKSSASYRVRIALNIKEIPYETIQVHLLQDGGQQHRSNYKQINPQELVPTLEHNGIFITQSLAIIDYLEQMYPAPALLPKSNEDRAQIYSLALSIVSDIHPLNNLRVINELTTLFSANEDKLIQWRHTWFKLGFDALEKKLKNLARDIPVCYGHAVSLADICLIPQVYSANRFKFSLDAYPLIQQINQYCLSIESFKNAAPNE